MAETEERRSEGTEVGQGGTRREWETDLDFGGHLGGEKKMKKKQKKNVVGVDVVRTK